MKHGTRAEHTHTWRSQQCEKRDTWEGSGCEIDSKGQVRPTRFVFTPCAPEAVVAQDKSDGFPPQIGPCTPTTTQPLKKDTNKSKADSKANITQASRVLTSTLLAF